MNTRHQTDEAVLLAAGLATILGIAVGAPWVALSAVGLAAALTLRRSPVLRLATPVFRTFQNGDGGYGRDFPTPDPDGQDETEDGSEEDERTYEDLAASLESDEEDISFLPPYASGDTPAESAQESLAILWEPLPDSSLLNLLKDVLESSSKMPTHRRFALGTVAIIRNLLQPSEVEQILDEQRRYPRLRFGDIAVQLGLLSREQIRELLEAQREGVFTDEEILDTRARLQAFRLDSERRESA